MKLNKLAIVHASRGRPQRCFDAAIELTSKMTALKFTYIISLDDDDPKLPEYKEILPKLPFPYKTVSGMSRGACDAMNRGATQLEDDDDLVMIYSEDIVSPQGWDKLLQDIAEKIDNEVYYIHISNVQNAQNCAIIPLLSRGFYKKLGYVFYPEYISMYADNELIIVAKKLGILHDVNIPGFSHQHPAWGLNEWDDTYRRSNQSNNYNQGCDLINRRMATNFDNLIPPPPKARIDRESSEPKGVYDKNKLYLPDVTLVCADTTYYNKTMHALHWNLIQCGFPESILFTDDNFDTKGFSRETIDNMGLKIVKIPTLCGKVGTMSYSHFMLKDIYKYIKTPYFLITQQDGWIIDTDAWTDDFLKYDYIGSVWSMYSEKNVGNGGFSLRSTNLHKIVGEDPDISGITDAEDFFLCRRYRTHLEEAYGIKYAPEEVANLFAYDHLPKPGRTFGFHQVDTNGYATASQEKYGYFE